MNKDLILSDLQTAQAKVARALERAVTLAMIPDLDAIANDLRDASHVLDRLVNEVQSG